MTAPVRSDDVIAKWKALVAARQSDVRAAWALAGMTVVGMIALLIAPSGWLFSLTAFVAFCFIINQFVTRGSMFCPNCGNPPLSSFDRTWPTDARVCVHCNYILRD